MMPLFRKFNPRKFDPKSGMRAGSKGKGGKQGGAPPATVPFGKLVVGLVLAYQVSE